MSLLLNLEHKGVAGSLTYPPMRNRVPIAPMTMLKNQFWTRCILTKYIKDDGIPISILHKQLENIDL